MSLNSDQLLVDYSKAEIFQDPLVLGFATSIIKGFQQSVMKDPENPL